MKLFQEIIQGNPYFFHEEETHIWKVRRRATSMDSKCLRYKKIYHVNFEVNKDH